MILTQYKMECGLTSHPTLINPKFYDFKRKKGENED